MSTPAAIHARASGVCVVPRARSRSRAARWHTTAKPRSRSAVASARVGASSVDTDGSYLVTGAAGFIGSHLCELLLSRGAAVVAVDNLDAHGPYPVHFKEANLGVLRACAAKHAADGASLRFIRADVSDATAARALFELAADETEFKKPVTRICHLGARSGVAASFDDAAGVVVANVASTAALLSAAADFGVDAFVLGSSGSVYGDGAKDNNIKPTPSLETDKTDDPESPYAASKRAAELVCAAFRKSRGAAIRVVTVCRIFTVYGERGRPDMAVFRFVRSYARGETLFRFGDGESSWRDYAHVTDVARGLFEAMHREENGEPFAILNVASGVPTKLRRLIETVASACGGDPAAVEERPPRPGDVGGTFADVTAAEEILRWRAEIGLSEGIERTAAWYASDASEPWRDP